MRAKPFEGIEREELFEVAYLSAPTSIRARSRSFSLMSAKFDLEPSFSLSSEFSRRFNPLSRHRIRRCTLSCSICRLVFLDSSSSVTSFKFIPSSNFLICPRTGAARCRDLDIFRSSLEIGLRKPGPAGLSGPFGTEECRGTIRSLFRDDEELFWEDLAAVVSLRLVLTYVGTPLLRLLLDGVDEDFLLGLIEKWSSINISCSDTLTIPPQRFIVLCSELGS
mmetsp:Transcript_70510/g.106664  ORF Transcript_70510/g.106664 Transcript_70510/m.106664 type:complete len:222 (+) Transcript_70510:1571-2236(+)